VTPWARKCTIEVGLSTTPRSTAGHGLLLCSTNAVRAKFVGPLFAMRY
jgi:hypothetical protein